MLDGPIHKGIFPYVRSLPPTPNFPIMIYPAQVVWPFQSVTYLHSHILLELPLPSVLCWYSNKHYRRNYVTHRMVQETLTYLRVFPIGNVAKEY